MEAETKTTSTSSVQVCQNCQQNFTIEQEDFSFYEKIKVPPPTFCSECRHQKRNKIAGIRKLWHRSCMCDKTSHHNHLDIRCPNEFETSYAPERQEIVYCEKCYQQEVY